MPPLHHFPSIKPLWSKASIIIITLLFNPLHHNKFYRPSSSTFGSRCTVTRRPNNQISTEDNHQIFSHSCVSS
ncbi:hypothetical protein Hanom_Chr16g01480651 [Helianthus anomalus]